MCRVHVKALINPIGDVVMKNFFSVFIDFHVLRMNVGDQRESLFSEISAWLWNHSYTLIRKVFLQAFVDDFGNASLEKCKLELLQSLELLITIVSVSRPGKPPPMSKRSIFSPNEFPYLKASDESLIAFAKISYSRQPGKLRIIYRNVNKKQIKRQVPTPMWNATPLIFKFNSFAFRSKNWLCSPGIQPNFSPNPILFVVLGSKRKRNNNLRFLG